jgi:hypothetical protein
VSVAIRRGVECHHVTERASAAARKGGNAVPTLLIGKNKSGRHPGAGTAPMVDEAAPIDHCGSRPAYALRASAMRAGEQW